MNLREALRECNENAFPFMSSPCTMMEWSVAVVPPDGVWVCEPDIGAHQRKDACTFCGEPSTLYLHQDRAWGLNIFWLCGWHEAEWNVIVEDEYRSQE